MGYLDGYYKLLKEIETQHGGTRKDKCDKCGKIIQGTPWTDRHQDFSWHFNCPCGNVWERFPYEA